MNLGIAYYPERCDYEQWKIDYQKMIEAGITTIRIGEFAWSKIVPSKGVYTWDWLDACIQLAGEFGLTVFLCTPTACPPLWLIEKNHEVLPVNEKGERMVFGKRQHRCYNTLEYIAYSKEVVTAMARRYGKHKEVIGWQIDNELGGERQRCYCRNCEIEFQKYLQAKYETIERLNSRWGTGFWSGEFEDFSQVKVPLEVDGQLKLKHNPSLELEFWRFSSNSIVKFCDMQADIIRRHTDTMITTNTDSFAWGDCVNIYDLFQNLDIGGMDLYSENPCEIAFYVDLTRSLKESNRFYMMEYGVSSETLRSELTYLASSGCEFLSLFKMNPFPWGQEQGYNGLLTMSGQPTENHRMLSLANENDIIPWKETGILSKSKVGLFYSFDSSWCFSIATWMEKQERWIYGKYMLENVYNNLFQLGMRADFIFHPSKIEEFETIIMPKNIIYDSQLEERLIHFVENGGNLIITSDFFTKTIDNTFLTSTPIFYRKVLQREDNVFFPEMKWTEEEIRMDISYDEGRVLVLHQNADVNTWKKAIELINVK